MSDGNNYTIEGKLGEGYLCFREMMCRGFGEVFLARDELSKELRAIKKVKIAADTGEFESESQLLKSCVSNFIVRYCDVIRKENELWVRVG